MKQGKSGEALFFELAIEDLKQAADLFRPIYDRTNGIDGWVSIEVSPTLAYDTEGTIAEVRQLHALADQRPMFHRSDGARRRVGARREQEQQGRSGEPHLSSRQCSRRGETDHRAPACVLFSRKGFETAGPGCVTCLCAARSTSNPCTGCRRGRRTWGGPPRRT